MSKLVIIGNGFDRAHDMKTTYWDFRDFIEMKHPEILEVLEHYSLRSENLLWNDFENSLSKIDIDRLRYNSLLATIRGLNDDDYYSGEDDGVEYYLKDEIGFIYKWSDLILEWVEDHIKLPEKEVFKTDLISDQNFFISFNYTDTLEYTYGISDQRVRHIHGRAGYEMDLIMGHRNDVLLEKVKDSQIDYAHDQKESSLMKAVFDYLKASYKDVNAIIEDWKPYFDDYKSVEEVHIIGWSINIIDIPYFDFVIDLVEKNTPINIYYKDLEAKANFEKTLIDYIENNNILLNDVKNIQY